MKKYTLLYCLFFVWLTPIHGQKYTEILGRPTNNSITLNVLFDDQVDVYIEYGLQVSDFPNTTTSVSSTLGVPVELKILGLQSETRYYYRTRYRKVGTSTYLASAVHNFITQRKRGSTFTFTLESDPHPYDKKGSWGLWPICLNNQLKDSADFMLDLGDTFGDDHTPTTTTSEDVKQLHLSTRNFFGKVCHSLPLYFCLGNHEGESGYYLLQTPPSNLATYESLWRKVYYPNPEPDGFYSGNNTIEENGIGKPQNYYAWEWGDALFVVLDSYRYYTANAKPRGWDWTIGKTQYDWLKQTLENSTVKHKFVFTHHVLGETRGGINVANQYEWGGENTKGVSEFAANRPGWEMPIHQLMVKNNVDVFFQGHDHVYAREEKDNLVYQTIPMPSDSTYIIGIRDNGSAFSGKVIGGAGHLRVTVTPDSTRIDFVSAVLPKDETDSLRNRQMVYSYSVASRVASGITTTQLMNEWRVYPNPASDQLNISFRKPICSEIGLQICSIDGRIVAQNSWNSSETDGFLSYPLKDNRGYKLKNGTYIVCLFTDKLRLSHKVLVIK